MNTGAPAAGEGIHRRHAESVVVRALAESRVVIVHGPRQAGKTTLSRLVMPHARWVSLDSQSVLDACLADPVGFLEAYPKPLVIDEFQRGGDPLVRAIKLEVDRDRSRGQYLLTGSSRFLTVTTISESLAGRAQIVDLWPYAQGEADELDPGADTLLGRLYDDRSTIARQLPGPAVDRVEYFSRVCRGGYPEANELDAAARGRWFQSYLRTIIGRDVPEVARTRHLGELPRVMGAVAARAGQEMVVEHLARETGVQRQLLSRNYLPLLETIYLTTSLPAWSRNFTSRAVKHPKLYVADPGLAAHMLGVDARGLSDPTSAARGPLIETFAVNELIRQVSVLDEPAVSLHHFRTRDQIEVDVVAEASDGRVVAFEIKAARSIAPRAFRGLRHLRERIDSAGGRFVAGVVLYLGDDALPAGDRLAALPLSHLWRPPDLAEQP
jgi:uncharacterized protein